MIKSNPELKISPLHVGETILNLLNQSGMSQTEFARRAGMNVTSIKEMFGVKTMQTEKLRKISEALGINIFKLFKDNESETGYLENISQTGKFNSFTYNGGIINYNGVNVPQNIIEAVSDTSQDVALLKETIKELEDLILAKQETINIYKSIIDSKNKE